MKLGRYALFFVLGAGLVGSLFYPSEGIPEETTLFSLPLSEEVIPIEEAEKPSPVYSLPAPNASTFRKALTTKFWVGEDAGPENGFIANHDSYWDVGWVERYGGVDAPNCRENFFPCGFTPAENPFYFALPYGEFREGGTVLKESAKSIPWYSSSDRAPLLKNRWIEVTYQDTTCYGQWEDVGPFLTDDFGYVFGDKPPSNGLSVGAGLDISPALWDCLELKTNSITEWRFVKESEVPKGPWREIVTTSPVNWTRVE